MPGRSRAATRHLPPSPLRHIRDACEAPASTRSPAPAKQDVSRFVVNHTGSPFVQRSRGPRRRATTARARRSRSPLRRVTRREPQPSGRSSAPGRLQGSRAARCASRPGSASSSSGPVSAACGQGTPRVRQERALRRSRSPPSRARRRAPLHWIGEQSRVRMDQLAGQLGSRACGETNVVEVVSERRTRRIAEWSRRARFVETKRSSTPSPVELAHPGAGLGAVGAGYREEDDDHDLGPIVDVELGRCCSRGSSPSARR